VLAAIFIALAAATIAGAVLSGGDDGGSSPSSADNTPARPKADANKAKKKKEQPADKKQQQDEPAATPAAPAEEPAPAQEEQPAASYDPARGAALNDQAYVRMRQGDYAGAVPTLQEAVKLFPPDSTDIRYAYTLYNLGKSLREAGRPSEAIPYLEKRLRWSDQRDTVQRELDLARQQAGQG